MKAGRDVLLITPTNGFGGAELHTLRLALWLQARGDTPTLCFPECAGTLALMNLCRAANIDTLDAPVAPPPGGGPMETYEAQRAIVADCLDFSAFDFVFIAAPSPVACPGLLSSLAEAGVPGAVIFHLVSPGLRLPPAICEIILASRRPWLAFVAVSHFTHDMLCNVLGAPTNLGFADVIPNGVVIERSAEPVDLPSLIYAPGAQIVASLGRLHTQKGCLTLIEAIPLVVKKAPRAQFLWFGEGELEEEMIDRAKQLGVEDRLHLMGYTDRPVDVMAHADLVVFPTRMEGLSLALLEAMHAGAAIITTDVSYQGQILQHRKEASITPSDDPVSLAQEILHVLGDKDLTAAYRKNAASRAQEFTEERMLSDYEALMARLVAAVETKPTLLRAVCLTTQVEGDTLTLLIQKDDDAPLRIEGAALFTEDVAPIFDATANVSLMADFGAGVEQLSAPKAWRAKTGPVTPATALMTALASVSHAAAGQCMAIYARLVDTLAGALDQPLSNIEQILDAFHMLEDAANLSGERLMTILLSHASLPEASRDQLIERVSRDPDVALSPVGGVNAPPRPADIVSKINRALAPLHLTPGEFGLAAGKFFRHQGLTREARRFDKLNDGLGKSSGAIAPTRRRVAFCAEFFNFPVKNGGDARMLSLILAYQRLGFDVDVCLLVHAGNWAEKTAQMARMTAQLGVGVELIPLRAESSKRLREAHKRQAQGECAFPDFHDQQAFGLLRSFLEGARPDILHVNYCYFSWMALAGEGVVAHRVIDTHDLISRRLALLRGITSICGRLPQDCASIPETAHKPDFFVGLRYQFEPLELEFLSGFDTVMMISPNETEMLAQRIGTDTVRYVPMHMPYLPATTDPGGDAVFIGGRNPFNVIAAAALQDFIAPYAQATLRRPSPAPPIGVFGQVCDAMQPTDGLRLHGQVANIGVVYEGCGLALCPIPCGTGQNVKIVEALSRGVPVLAFASVGKTAGVEHGVNGMLFQSLSDMRRALVKLMADPDAVNRLQKSTRDWAAKRFTPQALTASIVDALTTTGFALPEPQKVDGKDSAT